MFAILHERGMFVADLFMSQSRLEAENALLRHQLTIAMRQAPPRVFPKIPSAGDLAGDFPCSARLLQRGVA